MGRPANFPLPLLSPSRRPTMIRCEACFHIGATVRMSDRLLCGECFFEVSMSEEAKRTEAPDQRPAEAAYEHVA